MCLSAAEDKMGWHGKTLPKDMSEGVIRELQSRIVSCNKRLYPAPPNEDTSSVSLRNIRMPSAPNYKPGDKVRLVMITMSSSALQIQLLVTFFKFAVFLRYSQLICVV